MSRIYTLLLLLLPVFPALAQQVPGIDRSQYSPAAYYSYTEPGETTIIVNVWGTVRMPGLYEMREGSHLSTLLSVAGGPEIPARTQNDRRQTIIRLNRGGSVVAEAVMENEVAVLKDDPVLQEGDVLTVETVTRQKFTWREIMPIISAGSSMAAAILYITQARKL